MCLNFDITTPQGDDGILPHELLEDKVDESVGSENGAEQHNGEQQRLPLILIPQLREVADVCIDLVSDAAAGKHHL